MTRKQFRSELNYQKSMETVFVPNFVQSLEN